MASLDGFFGSTLLRLKVTLHSASLGVKHPVIGSHVRNAFFQGEPMQKSFHFFESSCAVHAFIKGL